MCIRDRPGTNGLHALLGGARIGLVGLLPAKQGGNGGIEHATLVFHLAQGLGQGIESFFVAAQFANAGGDGRFLATQPVSYTHLDVYKRQNQQRLNARQLGGQCRNLFPQVPFLRARLRSGGIGLDALVFGCLLRGNGFIRAFFGLHRPGLIGFDLSLIHI